MNLIQVINYTVTSTIYSGVMHKLKSVKVYHKINMYTYTQNIRTTKYIYYVLCIIMYYIHTCTRIIDYKYTTALFHPLITVITKLLLEFQLLYSVDQMSNYVIHSLPLLLCSLLFSPSLFEACFQ